MNQPNQKLERLFKLTLKMIKIENLEKKGKFEIVALFRWEQGGLLVFLFIYLFNLFVFCIDDWPNLSCFDSKV